MKYAEKRPDYPRASQDKSTHAVVLFPLKFTLRLDKTTCGHVGFNFQDPELEIVFSLDIIC